MAAPEDEKLDGFWSAHEVTDDAPLPSISDLTLPMLGRDIKLDRGSSPDLRRERQSLSDAKVLIDQIRLHGEVASPDSLITALRRQAMTMVDVSNVLRAGNVEREPELVDGGLRYLVETQRMAVEVEFQSQWELRVLKGWRKK
jgi:hypothetical protein